MTSSTNKSNSTAKYSSALAEKDNLTKTDILLIMGTSVLLSNDMYKIDKLGIRLKPYLTKKKSLADLTLNESRQLMMAEVDAQLSFPCTPKEFIEWRDRNEPGSVIDPIFLNRYNSTRYLFDDNGTTTSRAKQATKNISPRGSGQAGIERYNKRNSQEKDIFWKPFIELMQQNVHDRMSYTQAARKAVRGTEIEPERLVRRYKTELRVGKIQKSIPDHS